MDDHHGGCASFTPFNSPGPCATGTVSERCTPLFDHPTWQHCVLRTHEALLNPQVPDNLSSNGPNVQTLPLLPSIEQTVKRRNFSKWNDIGSTGNRLLRNQRSHSEQQPPWTPNFCLTLRKFRPSVTTPRRVSLSCFTETRINSIPSSH